MDRSVGANAPSSCKASGRVGSLARSPIPIMPEKTAAVPSGVLRRKSRKLSPTESMSSVPDASRRTPQRSRALTSRGSLTVVADIDIELDFDFTPIGLAIKKAREAKKITRERLVENLGISTRHLQSVENGGQFPSFKLFIKLITMFDVSVDQYIFPDKEAEKSSARRRLDSLLDTLDDKDLSIIEATAYSLYKAKEQAEK